jgi:DNA-binding response OmpR family regulator
MAEMEIAQGRHRLLVTTANAAEDVCFAGWLQREGFEVMTVVDGQEALQIATSSWQPDVVLLDLRLLDVDGLAVCERIRATNQSAVIFVLSGESGEREIQSLDAGADDYVEKPFEPEVLLARVRAHVRNRQAAGSRRILMHGDLWLDVKNYATRVKGEWVDLRPQEFRLLIALAQSPGIPVGRQELVRRIAKGRHGASSRTVDIHISRIRARIEPTSDYTYIHSVRGFGYRLEPIPKEAAG